MSEQSLQEKIKGSRTCFDRLIQDYPLDGIVVAWTGGKDSTVVLSLWKHYLETKPFCQSYSVQALNLDTGCKFPEVMKFRDTLAAAWGLRLEVIHPDASALAHGPDPRDPVACCRRLKIEPLQQAIREQKIAVLLSGIRHDEHQSRTIESWSEERQNPDYILAHPILHWSEMDVWSYHLSQSLPYCELYDQGYRSLGCRPCTQGSQSSERSGRNQDKEEQLQLLRSMGYF